MIRIQNLTFAYEADQPPTLKNINLHLNAGEYIALIGPNGCGKTTLIRQLNALLLPSAGEVLVDGLNTRDLKSHREIRSRIGMVFQNPDNQIVGMSVEEDVAFGPGNIGLPAVELRQRVDQALAMVSLSGLEARPPHTLSGGQKQLLAIAGLLAMDPKVIVLDEPTSSLDPAGKNNVLTLLQKLKGQGIGIIHITHSMNEAAMADRVLVMDQGEIIADGRPDDILNQVQWLKSLGLAPPKVTELMWYLQQRGEDVETNIFTPVDAVDEITALLNKLRNSVSDYFPRKVGRNV
ncbi:hypothetical protein ASZ90_019206 [hydrocarbon metagenome]|uniref:ABC transporter domain-containing protein n=1 Tax=hydrocarbon metagenome TaxID=938273 RepID=A0A0W8E457_9ZZZZ